MSTTTDPRLITILTGGQQLIREVDPERLLRKGTVSAVMIDENLKGWKEHLLFANGTSVTLSGKYDDETILIDKITYWEESNEKNIRTEGSKTLSEALGDLSLIPAHLKQNLSPGLNLGGKDRRTDQQARWPKRNFLTYIKEASLYNVEGAEDETIKKRFRRWEVEYIFDEEYTVVRGMIRSSDISESGEISIKTEIDVYGLSGKKVYLKKKLGDGHSAIIECRGRLKDRTVPSLRVAYDLDKKIPVMYHPERKKNQTIGKPKGK